MHLPPPQREADASQRTHALPLHLATLWSRIARAQAIPDDVDVHRLQLAIRDRLRDPEWEVRLHALRVLAELLPISRNALAFPFDEVVDNLGHGSPVVRKAALDSLKVFCLHCEEPECAARAVVDRCNYDDLNKRSAASEVESNIITGLIISIPSIMAILRRRSESLDMYPVIVSLGFKLFDVAHRDVALRSMIKLRRVCGTNEFMASFSKLNTQIQDKFHLLCEVYDEDSFDVQYGPVRRITQDSVPRYTNSQGSDASKGSGNTIVYSGFLPVYPKDISSDESQEDSSGDSQAQGDVPGKVIMETEITFDSDTAITMTVLEEREAEPDSERNYASDDSGSSDGRLPRVFSESDSEDTDVVVSTQKRVRFGGETFKVRTPDSDNVIASEEENKIRVSVPSFTTIQEIPTEEVVQPPQPRKPRRSGIPLPVTYKSEKVLRKSNEPRRIPRMVKTKSKSLSELYDYFRMKNNIEPLRPQVDNISVSPPKKPQEFSLNFTEISKYRSGMKKAQSGFSLSVTDAMCPDKIPSPVESHREVEVLHNLQRSPSRSPRSRSRVSLDQDGFVLSVMRSSPELTTDAPTLGLLDSSAPPGLLPHYEWETLDAVPRHIMEQLHNTENWISAVRAADQLHRALLEPATVRALQPAGSSLAEHMWALGDAVGAARAPAESAVCALVRGAAAAEARRMLPSLVRRLVRPPPPAALPHALLARLTLPQLVELIFDRDMTGLEAEQEERGQLRGAWCVARAAGPAAVLAAVRRRLAGDARAEHFCNQLRRWLRRPPEWPEGAAPRDARASLLPVPAGRRRRRARSTPPPAPRAPPPRRLRPLADSAPLPGSSLHSTMVLPSRPLFPILDIGDSSAGSSQREDELEKVEPKETDSHKYIAAGDTIEETFAEDDNDSVGRPATAPRSPSIRIEDYTEREREERPPGLSPRRQSGQESEDDADGAHRAPGSRDSLHSAGVASSPVTRASTPQPSAPASRASNSLPASRAPTPSPRSPHPSPATPPEEAGRDVRAALAACVAPPKLSEDWEAIVRGLREAEQLAGERTAHAPAAAWRAAARATAAHVRSLRSRVARAACSALGALFESRGRTLEPETEEAAGALLDRSADVNRFLRADAAAALARVACGVAAARAVAALARRGAAHRAGAVRAAAAGALAELVVRGGAARALDMPPEPRALLLRVAVELLGDAGPDARAHARRLCVALAEDTRFRPLLKETLPASKYRSVEKSVDNLRGR